MIAKLCILLSMMAGIYSLPTKGPEPCKSGAPDIPVAVLPPFTDKFIGINYVHGFDTSDPQMRKDTGKTCFYTTTKKIKIDEKDLYADWELQFYNKTTSKWEGMMKMNHKFDLKNPANFCMVDDNLKLVNHACSARTIAAKDNYSIDYGWYLKFDSKSGECDYWWAIYSRSKTLSGSDYDEAISQLKKLNLVTSGAEKLPHDCPNEP